MPRGGPSWHCERRLPFGLGRAWPGQVGAAGAYDDRLLGALDRERDAAPADLGDGAVAAVGGDERGVAGASRCSRRRACGRGPWRPSRACGRCPSPGPSALRLAAPGGRQQADVGRDRRLLGRALLQPALPDREDARPDPRRLLLGAAVGGGEAVGGRVQLELALAGVDGRADRYRRDALERDEPGLKRPRMPLKSCARRQLDEHLARETWRTTVVTPATGGTLPGGSRSQASPTPSLSASAWSALARRGSCRSRRGRRRRRRPAVATTVKSWRAGVRVTPAVDVEANARQRVRAGREPGHDLGVPAGREVGLERPSRMEVGPGRWTRTRNVAGAPAYHRGRTGADRCRKL